MTSTPSSKDQMHYDAMAQEALRGVVKMALKRAASPEGLPGEHHFYITFKTQAPGVSGPTDLLAQYPKEMTIVVQHQFWDLAPGETFFAVTLKFHGQPKRLSVPYSAITRFYDPTVPFVLPFDAPETLEDSQTDAGSTVALPAPEADADKEEANIVSLDQFRKK